MVNFHSYVSLPEGNHPTLRMNHGWHSRTPTKSKEVRLLTQWTMIFVSDRVFVKRISTIRALGAPLGSGLGTLNFLESLLGSETIQFGLLNSQVWLFPRELTSPCLWVQQTPAGRNDCHPQVGQLFLALGFPLICFPINDFLSFFNLHF